MIFSELYSAYYNTVAKILKSAVSGSVGKRELDSIIEKNAFGESMLSIAPALKEGRWQLIKPDGSTSIQHVPTMPLTTLQKRWLKAIWQDPRIKLFADDEPDFPDVTPLFKLDDIILFDKYLDGDPFTDETYIKNFRLILDAIKNRYPLSIDMESGKGNRTHMNLMPEYLEYSEKDDKFRLICSGCRYGKMVNLGRIVNVKPYSKPFEVKPEQEIQLQKAQVTFELTDTRNALERALMHFAHFEKQAQKLEGKKYKVTVSYEKDDETEIVIRILSFGPMVKVTEPQHFVELIKERLINQISCEQ